MESLLLVILGFFLGQLSLILRSWWSGWRRNDSTRTLINCETESNKQMLVDYWRLIIRDGYVWKDEKGNVDYVLLVQKIAGSTLPPFSKQAWVASFDKIPSAYDKSRVKELWNSYGEYDELKSLYEHIRGLAQKGVEQQNRIDPNGIANPVNILCGADTFMGATPFAAKFEMITRILLGESFTEYPEYLENPVLHHGGADQRQNHEPDKPE